MAAIITDDFRRNSTTFLLNDIIDQNTGEIYYEGGIEITSEIIDNLQENKVREINIVDGNKDFSSMLINVHGFSSIFMYFALKYQKKLQNQNSSK